MKKRILSAILVLALALSFLPIPAQAASGAGVDRVAGSDRYKTAFLAADELKVQLGVEKFSTVVVASGTDFADALSGSYLAAVKSAPMLLVRNNKNTMQQVKDYIKANLASGGTVYLLGGVNAVPKAMESGLEGFTVKRLGGNTRYDTNLLILAEAGVGTKDILVCTGKGFADSLSASAAKLPILLVKDGLTEAQKNFLKDASGKKYIIGGTSAVSTRIENQVKSYGEVKRLGGNTRYETSVLVAKEFFSNPKTVVLAYAQNFPDGLSGGALAAGMNAPLILTASGKDKVAAEYTKEMGIGSGFVLGGATLINDKAANNIIDEENKAPEEEKPDDEEPTESEAPLVIQWYQSNSTVQFEAPYVDSSLSYHTQMMWAPLYNIDGTADPESDEKYVWGLATGYELDTSAMTSTITLREGCYWSDGQPITVDDVVFSIYATILDPNTRTHSKFKYVSGFGDLIAGISDKLEGLTVEGNKITLKLTQANDNNWAKDFYVLPAHCFEGIPWVYLSSAPYWSAPVTSGPYKFVEASFPNWAKLTRNERYFGEPAGIKNVTMTSYMESGYDATIVSMVAGELDVVNRVTVHDGQIANIIVGSNPDCVAVPSHSNNIRSLVFNMGARADGKNKDLLVTDPNVRLAISLVIDEDTIAEYAAAYACKVVGSPKNKYTTHECDSKNKSLDLMKAKTLLDAAGWDYTDEIEILCYYTDSVSLDILEIIKEDAAKIGLKINYFVVTENAADAIYVTKNWDLMFFQASGADINPVASVLNNLRSYSSWNWYDSTPWVGEKYDALYNELNALAPGSAEYIAAVHKAQKAIYDDNLVIPIYTNGPITVYNSARLYVPETAFDCFDNVLDLHLWKILK